MKTKTTSGAPTIRLSYFFHSLFILAVLCQGCKPEAENSSENEEPLVGCVIPMDLYPECIAYPLSEGVCVRISCDRTSTFLAVIGKKDEEQCTSYHGERMYFFDGSGYHVDYLSSPGKELVRAYEDEEITVTQIDRDTFEIRIPPYTGTRTAKVFIVGFCDDSGEHFFDRIRCVHLWGNEFFTDVSEGWSFPNLTPEAPAVQ